MSRESLIASHSLRGNQSEESFVLNGRAIFTGMHTFWYKLSRGRLMGSFRGAPVLLLTTIGRKTGKPRTTPLLYLEDEANLVIVASNGGRDEEPSWWKNLKHNPSATVQIKSARIAVSAKPATSQEKTRLWELVTKMYPQYGQYQAKTKREIPLVILARENRDA